MVTYVEGMFCNNKLFPSIICRQNLDLVFIFDPSETWIYLGMKVFLMDCFEGNEEKEWLWQSKQKIIQQFPVMFIKKTELGTELLFQSNIHFIYVSIL